MKKISRILMALVILVVALAIPVSAYKPIYDQMNDIRWFAGYDPESGRSVISDTAKGVNLKFKKDPDMWANRVVCGGSYNLKNVDPLKVGYKADEEGIYLHLEDVKWDVPKATLSNPKPETSVMIGIVQGEGGWSDGRGLLFWITRDKDNKYRVEVLRGREASETAGMTPEESTKTFHVVNVDLEKPLGNEINFYMRKTSAAEWTVNLNDNQFKMKDSETVKERFIDPGAVYVSLGTWNSSANVEYTVSEIWSYGCVEYSKKVSGKNVRETPPAFVQKMSQAKPDDKPKPPVTSSTVKPPVTQSNTATSSSTVISSDVASNASDVSSEILDTSSYDETGSELLDSSDVSSDDKAADVDEKKTNPVVIIIIVAIVLVLIGGGVAFYFLFIRKKAETTDNTDQKD